LTRSIRFLLFSGWSKPRGAASWREGLHCRSGAPAASALAESFYNVAVQRAARVQLLLVALVIVSVGASVAQGEIPVAEEIRLAPTIARLEASLAELEELEARVAARDRAEEAEAEGLLEEVEALASRLTSAEEGSAAVEAIYDQVIPLVEQALDLVTASLERASGPSRLPAYLDRLDLIDSEASPFGQHPGALQTEGSQRVAELEDEVRRKIEDLKSLEVEMRLADVRRDVTVASGLYQLRIAALAGLPLERRLSVKALDEEGAEALRLELRVMRLIWRLQVFSLKGQIATFLVKVRGLLTAVVAGWLLVRLLLVALLWRWVRRNRGALLTRLERRARAVEELQRRSWALRMVDLLASFAPWGTFLLGLLGLQWAFGPPVARIPFLRPTLGLIAVYGLYRLLVDLVSGAVSGAAESTGLELSDEQQDRLRHGSKWVMRAFATVVFLLWLIQMRLGQGIVYSKVRTVGVALVGTVLLLVVLRWHRQVAEMYLALRAHGWIADALRQSEGRLVGFVVTPFAFLWLCLNGVVVLVRGIAFSFERTRSAAAYVTRRQISRVAEQRGYASGSIESLPDEVVRALDSDLTVEDMVRARKLIGMDLAETAANVWAGGGIGGSFLLAAESGFGKRSWLERFEQRVGGTVDLTVESRVLSPVKLRAFLQEGLLPGIEGALDRDPLIEALNGSERRIVVLKRAENLFLGTVNGYRALAELGPIIDGTRSRIFWILTMGGLAWSHLRAAGKELAFLRRKIVLEPWSLREIQELIDSRLAAGGLEVSYAGLMAVEGRKEDEAARNRTGKQAFLHLLFDYSDGNPEIALHYFLRSLVVGEDGRLEVLPFEPPHEDDLGSLGYESLFLLAAVVRHGSLAPSQAATATDYPVGRVEGLFLQLLDLGTVFESDGIYRVTTDWRATVLRVLRRWNILVA
jgi:hypothetical protein